MTLPPIVPDDAHACHGPCKQGRLPCPTPEACERPDPDDYDHILRDVLIAIVAVGAMATITLALLGAYA